MKFFRWIYNECSKRQKYSDNIQSMCGIGRHKSRAPGRHGDYILYGGANCSWILSVELEFVSDF